MKRITGFILLCVFVVFLIISCSSRKELNKIVPGVTDNEILVGSSVALGGHASYLGTKYLNGAKGYFQKINELGGIYGRKIKLIVYDDKYDPPLTVANTQKLINDDKVFCLFNYVGTPTSVKVIDIINKAKIPTLGFFTGAEILRTPHRPFMFHVRDSYYAEAEGAIAYFVDNLGFKNIAVMYQEDDFGLAVLSGIQLALNARNLEPSITATYLRGTMDVEDAFGRIKAKNVEAVIMVGTYAPLAKFIKLFHNEKIYPYFHTVSFVGSEAFGSELVKNQEIDSSQYDKIIVTQVVPSPFSLELEGIKEYLDIVAEFHPKDNPNYVELEGFINAKVLVKALQDAGPKLNRENFIEAIESLRSFDVGIGKKITYDVLDHVGLDGIYYSRVNEKGEFMVFEP